MSKKIKIISITFLLLIIVAIIYAMFFFPTHRGGDDMLESLCKGNLEKIYSALTQYSADNNSYYPSRSEGLQILVTKGLLPKDKIKCLLANIKGGMYFYKYKEIRPGSDYDYYGEGHTSDFDPKIYILCMDKPGNHADKAITDSVNILFSDGEVKTFPVATWKADAEKYIEENSYDE